jgi:cobalamin biosynthesis Mg chelatase CobN
VFAVSASCTSDTRRITHVSDFEPSIACYLCCWLQVADGSFDKFLSKFVAINTDGLGYVDLTQLAVHIASISSSSGSSSDAKSGSRGSSRGSSNGSAAASSRGGASGSAAAAGGGKPRQSSAMSSASTRLSAASSYTSSTPVSKAACPAAGQL